MSVKGNRFEVDFANSPSLTKQSDKDAADVNKILKRYAKTGVLSHVSSVNARYGDFSNLPDFQSVQQAVIDAHDAFNALPAALRKRFDNDPGELINFCNDPNNRAEAIFLGLIDLPVADLTKPAEGSVTASMAVEGGKA